MSHSLDNDFSPTAVTAEETLNRLPLDGAVDAGPLS